MTGYFYHDRVFVLRPGTKQNRAGEPVLDYTGLEDAPGFPRDMVQVRPISQTEQPDVDRLASTEIYRLATKPGSGDWDVRDTDWIRLPDGKIVTVEGQPAKPSDPLSGKLHHVEIQARRTAG